MNLRNLVPGSLLALSLLIGAGSLATHAGDDQNASRQAPLNGVNVAVVDMERVYEASDGPQLVQVRAAQSAQEMKQQVTRVLGVPYLELQELGEFLNLLDTPNLTPAQQARLDALKGLSDMRAQELDTLQHKAQLNNGDKQRIQTLQAASNRLQNDMPKIEDELNSDRRAKLQDYQAEQINRLRGVVGKLAASRGIFQVFSAGALIYSVNDITNDVIQKVSKHK